MAWVCTNNDGERSVAVLAHPCAPLTPLAGEGAIPPHSIPGAARSALVALRFSAASNNTPEKQ